MKIDCSKLSNKDDLLVLIAIFVVIAVLAMAIFLAIHFDNFYAGFFSATITWKWKEWLYEPIDRLLEKLWSK